MEQRLNKLRQRFRSLGVANFLVTRLSNVRWLCGYTGSNGLLLVTGREAFFITDGRYINQAQKQVKDAKVLIYSGGKNISDAFIRELKINKEVRFKGRVGIDAPHITVEMYLVFREYFPKSELVSTENVVEDLAMIHEKDEIDAIRKAVKITDTVFKEILPLIKPGIRELDIAAEIIYRHMQHGADKNAFESIVASGPRSAMPHGIASNRKITPGDFVTLDFGCLYNGYPSDMTRTVVVGKASEKQKKIYNIVYETQETCREAVVPGAKCSDIHNLSRKMIEDAGYGKYYTHSLGHGLGLEVHARPTLSHLSNTILEPGMIVTVEPGIYIDRFGGVRIEDDLLVTENGHEVLNRSPRQLMEL